MKAKTNGDISFWYADIGGVPAYRAGLPGDRDADVCIVGAGFTGLWTAYYLKKADPSLRIMVIEKEFAGFGASGRNGGALTGGFAWSREVYQKSSSREAVIDFSKALAGTVDEVIAVCEAEGIDADICRNDWIKVATSAAQWHRLQQTYEYNMSWGVSRDRMRLMGSEDTLKRIQIKDAVGAIANHGTARLQPAKLARGLAAVVEKLGVVICEQTEVMQIEKGRVTTNRGSIKAPFIVRATEGYTANMSGSRRAILPLKSSMIVTEPLSKEMWDEIGWGGNEFVSNASHQYFYAQRTREGRIALGGGGRNPYLFGSKTDKRGQTEREDVRVLQATLARVLPQTKNVALDHVWCGVMAVPRDWCASVGIDRHSGMAWGGGYVGIGVSTTNLAGQTLADLILERDTHLVRHPWVNHKVRNWEPEPLRWLGVHGSKKLYALADRLESDGRARTAYPARLANLLTGM